MKKTTRQQISTEFKKKAAISTAKCDLIDALINYYEIDYKKFHFVNEGQLGEIFFERLLEVENLAIYYSNICNKTKIPYGRYRCGKLTFI